MVSLMLNKLLKLFKLPEEFGDKLKVELIGDQLTIINYQNLINYTEREVVFSTLIVRGSSLILSYQNTNVVQIIGKIKEIIKGEE